MHGAKKQLLESLSFPKKLSIIILRPIMNLILPMHLNV